ncbi:MAG: glycosyltransferase family 4 protein [Acidobacteria bacterium]|nr:glycosyltransferase family 4 protein [Acidobacteriota bacterium]
MISWHILTGEYPPQPGGVSDYTRLVARGLAEAGDRVEVWSTPCGEASPDDPGVSVHRLPDHFGPRSLKKLGETLRGEPEPRRILVQYVPHAFGWKALNFPFCLWLWSRRRESVWSFFHEVAFPLSRTQSLAHNLLGAGTRAMASLVARASERIFISIPAWEETLKSLGSGERPVKWLPIPSNIPVNDDPDAAATIRARYAAQSGFVIGHFGTYGQHIVALLKQAVPQVLAADERRLVILLGRGGEVVQRELIALHPGLRGQLYASGELSAAELSAHLQSVDLLLQLYPDGISTRRTSAMAGLQHGLPILTTGGNLTESFWRQSAAVTLAPVGDVPFIEQAVQRLQEDGAERARMSAAARALYQEQFDVRHTIAALRGETGR